MVLIEADIADGGYLAVVTIQLPFNRLRLYRRELGRAWETHARAPPSRLVQAMPESAVSICA
jgi:hypothetical protein